MSRTSRKNKARRQQRQRLAEGLLAKLDGKPQVLGSSSVLELMLVRWPTGQVTLVNAYFRERLCDEYQASGIIGPAINKADLRAFAKLLLEVL